MPQPPQLARSMVGSVQRPPQSIWPVGHTIMHAPLTQLWPMGHALPHMPQLRASVAVSAQ